MPGALRAAATDANGDGWTDLIALFAQGDEQIVLFENQRNGTFLKQVLLEFPPSYVSGYFERADVDGDGDVDVLLGNRSVAGGAAHGYGGGWQREPVALLLENKTNAPKTNVPATARRRSGHQGSCLLLIGMNP